MNEKVIEKIADELGVAVGTAGDFIADILPQYAAFQIMNKTPIVFFLLLLCIAAIVAIVICIKKAKKAKEDCRWDDRYGCIASSIVAAIVLAVFSVFLCFVITRIAGWYMFPEAMLFDMTMKAVGC